MFQDKQRPLMEHLEELRRRLFIVVPVLLVATGVCVAFFPRIMTLLLAPAEGRLSSTVAGGPIFTEVTELLAVTVKVALLGGFVLALPLVVYQVIMFAAPGLTRKERRYVFAALPGALISFAVGMAFAYLVILPPILGFLLTYGHDVATPMIRIGNYVNVVTTVLFWMGLSFETPLIMFLLAKTGVVSPNTMAHGRRYAVVLAFVLGAIITPTFDPLNQSLTAGPIIVLYELGIWLAKLARWERKPARRRSRASRTKRGPREKKATGG